MSDERPISRTATARVKCELSKQDAGKAARQPDRAHRLTARVTVMATMGARSLREMKQGRLLAAGHALAQVSGDVFHDHNGVIDHQADREARSPEW